MGGGGRKRQKSTPTRTPTHTHTEKEVPVDLHEDEFVTFPAPSTPFGTPPPFPSSPQLTLLSHTHTLHPPPPLLFPVTQHYTTVVSARLRAAASTRNTEQLPEVVRPSALHAAELYMRLYLRIAASAQRERRRTKFYLKKQNKTKKPKQSSRGREVRCVEPAVNYLCFLFAHPSPPSTALVEFGSVLVCPPPPSSLPLLVRSH